MGNCNPVGEVNEQYGGHGAAVFYKVTFGAIRVNILHYTNSSVLAYLSISW